MTPQEAYERVQVGFQAYQAGRFDEAEQIADSVIVAAPKDPNGLYLKGMNRMARKDFEGALAAFMPAHQRAPGWADVVIGIGLVHFYQARFEAAHKWFEQAERAAPKAFQPRFFRGRILEKQGDFSGAMKLYEDSVELAPENLEALGRLARIKEQFHELQAAADLADKALNLNPKDPVALGVRSRVDLRNGEFERAAVRIEENLDIAEGSPTEIDFAMGVLGEAREKLGDFPAAFEAFYLGAQHNKRFHEPRYEDGIRASEPGTLTGVRSVRATFEDMGVRKIDRPADNLPAPAFLVGFIRSGTTLLEQILAAHPDIETSDEEPILNPTFADVGTSAAAIEAFLETDRERISAIRHDYWARARADGPPPKGQLFVDKLPFNVFWIGLIAKVFPEARIVFALRDPRDAVMSAFKQRFQLNRATYHMLTLEDAADYYDAAIGAGVAARRTFPLLEVLDVKYEDVVADLERQARRTIDFLGLPWSDEVLAYREKLKGKAISTPSVRQVVSPIYASSIGLWKNYDFALEPVRPVLDPWAQYWGYPVD